MKVTDVRCVQLRGTIDADAESFFEDRLWRPTASYDGYEDVGSAEPETDATDASFHPYVEDGELKVAQIFLEVETDEGITGLAGPIDRLWAYAVLDMASLVVGRNPLATEKILDLLYKHYGDGREGLRTKAASVLDVALWDIRGKYFDAPVHELLGGPTRRELPAYASMLRYSLEPQMVRERAAEFKSRGFPAQKWFFRYGDGAGREGIEKNVAAIEAAREAVGDEYDLMFDCWRKWGLSYAREMIDEIAPYDPRWIEQPLDDAMVDQSATLASEAPFPIAGGEHTTTRWSVREALEKGAFDVLQPDIYYTGGITEMKHICSLASASGTRVVLHGHSLPANVQFTAAASPTAIPIVEYLVKWNEAMQHFFEDPIVPENGTIDVPSRPGIGTTIDESKVESEREIQFIP